MNKGRILDMLKLEEMYIKTIYFFRAEGAL